MPSTHSIAPRWRPAAPTTAHPVRGPAEMKYYAAFVLDPDGNDIGAGVRE